MNVQRNNRGVAYLAVLVAIILVGIALGAASQSWRMVMQRDREEELLFRGTQIRNAIADWYGARPAGHVATPLRDLKDLLRDPRTPETVRYLRRLYPDPMTNGDWLVISDPATGIRGVVSSSDKQALKTSGFSDDLEDFNGKTRYNEWHFVYTPAVQGQYSSSRSGAGH
jgi:type II secretory pathway pseudopilin PulG